MRKRIFTVLLLMMLLLMLEVSTSVRAKAAPKITGTVQWSFPGFRAWAEFNVHQVALDQAEGMANLKEYDEELGWRRWKAHAICVAFGEGLDGGPGAAIVLQVDRISGWTYPGEKPGQYIKLWGSDGGTPAAEGDLAGLIVFPPEDDQPSCDYELPWAYWPLSGGNLVIHD